MLPERPLNAMVGFFLPSGSPFASVQGGVSPRMARWSSTSRRAPILLVGMDRSIAQGLTPPDSLKSRIFYRR